MNTDPSTPKEETVPELFAKTLSDDYDDDGAWDAVWTLRLMGTPEVYKACIQFCRSDEPLKRARGIDVLGLFGCKMSSPPHFEERIDIILEYLSDESERVVESAAWSLSHMKGKKAVEGLLTLKHNPNKNIRQAVAAGLIGETAHTVIETLIELMQDIDDDVRDWATWSLGSEPVDNTPPLDTPIIREALRGRLTDTSEDVRLEAIWGLAIRKDEEGIQILLDRLEANKWVSGDQSAAEYLLDYPQDTPVARISEGLRRILAEK